jgi:hypothetical protein
MSHNTLNTLKEFKISDTKKGKTQSNGDLNNNFMTNNNHTNFDSNSITFKPGKGKSINNNKIYSNL